MDQNRISRKKNIMKNRITPKNIQSLKENEVFVYVNLYN